MIKADALGSRRPDFAAEVLHNVVNLVAGKSIFSAVGHPGTVLEPMQAAVARHPYAAIPRLEHGVDPAQTGLHGCPGLSVDLVDHVSAATPDIAFACLQQTHGAATAKFLHGQKRFRFLVPHAQTETGAQTQS